MNKQELSDRVEELTKASVLQNEEILQILGKVLGYPWYKDDQENFPGATEKDGVATGDHVAASIAAEAADVIRSLTHENSLLKELLQKSSENL